MPRSRNIKPGFFQNPELTDCSVEARLLFIGLWTLADRDGRLEDRPRQIKLNLYPADDFDVIKLLDELAGAKDDTGVAQIIRYEVDGKKCIWIPKFTKHQTPHNKEKQSSLPAFSVEAQKLPGKPRKKRASPVKVGRESAPTALNPESGTLNPEQGTPSSGENKSRRPDPIWDKVADIWFGGEVLKPNQSRCGKVVRDLKAFKATPEEIQARVDRYRAEWPNAESTPEAIVKHWDRFSKEQHELETARNSNSNHISRIPAKPGKYDHIEKRAFTPPPF